MSIFPREQTHIIVKEPHLLFTGANGHKTYGITVRHINEGQARMQGYKVEYSINDHSLITRPAENFKHLGLTIPQIKELQAEIKTMSDAQL